MKNLFTFKFTTMSIAAFGVFVLFVDGAAAELTPAEKPTKTYEPSEAYQDNFSESRPHAEGVAIHIVPQRADYQRRYYRNDAEDSQTLAPDEPDPMPRRNTRGMSLTLRSSALKIGGEGLRQGGINSGNLKGLGLGIQLALDKHWGIELSADHLSMGSDRATLTVMPMTVGLISRLFPESRFSIYAINGLSAVHTNIARASGPEENFTQFGVQFILGAEFRLNEHLHLSADARGLVLRSRPSTEQDDQKTTEQGLTQDRPPPNQERQLRSGLQSGVQFTAGIGYRW